MLSVVPAIGHSFTSRQNGVVELRIPVTIIAVMMKSNYLRLADVARVAKQFDAPLRVNVYQAVRSDIYALSYEEYWEGFRRLFDRPMWSQLANRWCARWQGCHRSGPVVA